MSEAPSPDEPEISRNRDSSEGLAEAVSAKEVEEIILRDVPELKEKLTGKEIQTLSRVVAIRTESIHSGPLPRPADLEAYGRVIPNGAERLMSLVEREQAHRFTIDAQQLRLQNA